MPRRNGSRRAAKGFRQDARGDGAERHRRLLRYSHIFASVVREILEMKFLEEVSPYPLTLSQFHLLKVIGLNGDHQVGEVANVLGVSPPAATKNIDKLERLGLIVRSPSKGDRRATLLSPSPKGRRLVRKYEELKAQRLAPVLDEFTPRELDRLAGLLERFSVSMLDLEQPRHGFCLRCSAYIESACPVGRMRGGCPYQKVRGARVGEPTTGEMG
ncbi:MAG: MarR family transcriptional regulator [Phycisphaerales bacterium]|nr:MAG: MarR family transcriptional regulator [Phycisphaerales bacterium]